MQTRICTPSSAFWLSHLANAKLLRSKTESGAQLRPLRLTYFVEWGLNLYNFIGAVLLKLRVLASLAPFDKTLIPNNASTTSTAPVAVETVEEFTETVMPEQIEAAA